MRRSIICIGAATFALAGTAALADPKDDLIAADKAFSAMSVAKGDSTAFLAFLADDGRLFGTGNLPPLIGKTAAAVSFKSGQSGNGAKSTLSWTPDFADISTDGALGFTDGHWTFDGAPDVKGQRFHATGHYLTVWRKDASGAWKVAADMGTTDPAPKGK
jgi:ketosteroid isomerase-like protein